MAKSTVNGFTRTDQAMLKILSDGNPHPRQELQACRGPSGLSSLAGQISRLRRRLPNGEDIVCVYTNRGLQYQHIRRLASPNDGRK